MNQDYTTENLYHFVGSSEPDNHNGNFNVLLKILKSRCISHPPHKPGPSQIKYTINRELSLLDEKLVDPEIVCFCDIPFDSLGIHVKKYGYFGIALNKVYLAARGCRPVMYMPYIENSISAYGISLINDIESIYRKVIELSDIENNNDVSRALGVVPDDAAFYVIKSCFTKDFVAFIKPYNVTVSNTDQSNYYMEREWRLLGNIDFNLNDNVLSHIVVKQGYKNHLLEIMPDLRSVEVKEIGKRGQAQ